ncbi:glycogenin-1 isoform X2 [Eurytemora carolleeae]|nr:glycogenin-1 isoform X2 [Eurytemora carolleeae]|eukprot:XP_023334235.1 glycogenin-1-like isoform X2 [Eurytemora affinis]
MVTQGVGAKMLTALKKKFDQVVSVEEMDSGDAENLRLLDRHDLGITFTKIRCWTLTQYSKCVFLDADTMLISNADELFDREEFSAAPDAGWPDCFNSGVFVLKPSLETYSAILKHAADTGSFDGGDQGLLNTYFSDWATKDISKHLPFIYNMVASASYSYLPAYKKFGQNVKIIHFIGATKPWLVGFDSRGEPLVGNTESHTKSHLQLWWQIFSTEVKPLLVEHCEGGQTDYPFLRVEVGSNYSSNPPAPAAPPADSRGDWEKGSPDFTGTAAFNNILKKMDETLSAEK